MISDKRELIILETIASAEEPLGSWTLVERLEAKGVSVSPATVGRNLKMLQAHGYLKQEKYKGRVITEKGEDAIRVFHELSQRDYHKKKLDELINTKILRNFIMVLEARKAIERTTARLAAHYATDDEISEMEEILERQSDNYSKALSIAENDLNFHKAIARASRNTVLESLYSIVALSGQQSELFEFIRKKVSAPIMTSHNEIFRAIRARSPEQAETSMIRHIDNLIREVNAYWHEYYSEE